MSNKNYSVTLKTNTMCPARAKVIEALQKASEEGREFKAKVIIGRETFGAGWYPVCIDTLSNESIFAVLDTMIDTDTEKKLDEDSVVEILGTEYTVSLKETDGKNITGELTVTKAKAVVERKSKVSDEIQSLVDEKVSAGVITKEEADKKVEIMLKNYVDEPLMKAVISGWKLYKKPVHGLRCEYVDPYLEDYRKQGKQGLIADELRNAVNRFPVIMEGEKSVGKNVFVETIAWLLNMPLFLITFSRNMSPSSVYGEKSTDNSASEYFKTEIAQKAAQAKQNLSDIENALTGMRRLYVDTAECQIAYTDSLYAEAYNELVRECVESNDFSPLLMKNGQIAVARRLGKLKENEDLYKAISELEEKRDAMKKEIAELELKSAQAQSVNIIIDQSELYDWLESGGLMVFNEMNMAEPNFFASFTNQLTDGTGFLFIPGRGEVAINPDCVLCGTQNADYEGVEQQNEATMSRFGCICFEQPKSIKGQLIVAVETELRAKGHTQTLDVKNVTLAEKFYKNCQKAVNKGDFTNAVLNIRGFVRALALVTSSDGNLSLYSAVEQHVINTCPVDERQPLKSTASTVFGEM